MNIYRHTDIYRQNYRHVGSPNDLPTYRHGPICRAMAMSVRGESGVEA